MLLPVAARTLGFRLIQLGQVAAYVAAAAVLLGAAGLLVRRMSDPNLKDYTSAADKFNLVFFMVTVAVLGVGYRVRPPGASVSSLVHGLLVFDTTVPMGLVLGAGLVLLAALVAYIPFTHMSHFIAKYFTYHAVRWDDAPNRRGSKIEARIAEYLTYRPTWAAAHIAGDGRKSWAEVATFNPAQENRK